MKLLFFIFVFISHVSSSTEEDCLRIKLPLSTIITIDSFPANKLVYFELELNMNLTFGLFSFNTDSQEKTFSLFMDSNENGKVHTCPDGRNNFLSGTNSLYAALRAPTKIYLSLISPQETKVSIFAKFESFEHYETKNQESTNLYLTILLILSVIVFSVTVLICWMRIREEKYIIAPIDKIENIADLTDQEGLSIRNRQNEETSDTITEAKSAKSSEVEDLMEMIDKVESSEYDKEIGNDEEMCIVCMERKRKLVFGPCMHICCCIYCSKKILNDKLNCPLCRTEIKSIASLPIEVKVSV